MKGCILLVSFCLLGFLSGAAAEDTEIALKGELLCSQCSKCDTKKCQPSKSYQHMTAWDDSLIAGASQSNYVSANDRGIYSVPDIKGGQIHQIQQLHGQVFRRTELSHNRQTGKSKPEIIEVIGGHTTPADWKLINPPKKLNHQKFGFGVNGSTVKCLTVLGGKCKKRTVGISGCKFDGSYPYQIFAFRFHYHKAFCCCGLHNH